MADDGLDGLEDGGTSASSDKKGGISHLHNKESHRLHGHAAGYKITAYFFFSFPYFCVFSAFSYSFSDAFIILFSP